MEQKIDKTKLKELESEILSFKEQEINKTNRQENNKQKNISIVYNITAELFGGVITAFILNKIYTHFFEKNTLVFAILLFLCSVAGLYNVIKIFLKK